MYMLYFNLLLVLGLCSRYKAEPQGSCAYYTKGSDGLYYKFHNRNTDWTTAKRTCEDENAHLAIYSSPATFEYIKNTYSFHMSGIWIGARDTNSRNNWRWLDQYNTQVQQEYWQDGEPNNYQGTQEDCGMINYVHGPGRLHDAPCRWTGPTFLCQKEVNCVGEEGYCVADGRDVDTTKLDVPEPQCLEKCLAFPDATGCSLIEGGCFVTTEYVTGGNGNRRHACWIISKCNGTGSLAEPMSCRPYHCYRDRAQMGYDIAHMTNTYTLDACSRHCCQLSQCRCIGFDWRKETGECWLSQTPRREVPTVKQDRIHSCQLKEIPDGYKKGYLGSFYKLHTERVDWQRAKDKCHKNGGKLAMDDSTYNAKHDYLVKTFSGQPYWIGIWGDVEGSVWKHADGSEVRTTFWDNGEPSGNHGKKACVVMWTTGRWHDASCSDIRSFVCEVIGKNVTTHPDAEEENNGLLALVVVVVIIVLFFITISVVCQHRARMRRRTATGGIVITPSTHPHGHHQVISNVNEAVSQNTYGPVDPSLPKPMDMNGIAVLSAPPQYAPPQYHALYPANNNAENNAVPGTLPPGPPPPSYYNVAPENYNVYTGNSSNAPS